MRTGEEVRTGVISGGLEGAEESQSRREGEEEAGEGRPTPLWNPDNISSSARWGWFAQTPQQSYEVTTIISPLLRMKKARHREVE